MTNRNTHIGVFSPEEVEEMRLEFDASKMADESTIAREDRAAEIVARYRTRKAIIESQNGGSSADGPL